MGVLDRPLPEGARSKGESLHVEYYGHEKLKLQDCRASISEDLHGLQVCSAARYLYQGPIHFYPVGITGNIFVLDSEKIANEFITTVELAIKNGVQIINLSMGTRPHVWIDLSKIEKENVEEYICAQPPPSVVLRKNFHDLFKKLEKNDIVIVFSLGNKDDEILGASLATAIKVALVEKFPKLFILVGEYGLLSDEKRRMPLGTRLSKEINARIGDRIIYACTPTEYEGNPVTGSSVAAPQVAAAIARMKEKGKSSVREAAELVLQAASLPEGSQPTDTDCYMGRGILAVE